MIKAIETEYRGCLFRSRLEARWAVFFSHLGIPYEYEKEGFDFDGKYYLPDFYLPELDLWVEIKPGSPEDWPNHLVFQYLEDNQEDFYSYWSQHFLLLVGLPKIESNTYGGYDIGYNGVIYGDCYYQWCECPDCGWIGIEFNGRSDRLDCKQCPTCWRLQNYRIYLRDDGTIWSPDGLGNNICEYHQDNWDEGCKRHGGNGDKGYNYDSPRLIEAYKRATQARFEYGESG